MFFFFVTKGNQLVLAFVFYRSGSADLLEVSDGRKIEYGRKLVLNFLGYNWGANTLQDWLKLFYRETSDGKILFIRKLD